MAWKDVTEQFQVPEPETQGWTDVTEQFEFEPTGVGKAAGLGIAAGGTKLAEDVNTAGEWLSKRVGWEKGSDFFREGKEFWQEKGKDFEAPSDISGSIVEQPGLMKKGSWWAYNVANVGTSFAPSMVAGIGAARYIKLAGQAYRWSAPLVERLGKLGWTLDKVQRAGAAAAAGFVGGAQEGASTYNEVLQRGGTEQEASLAGSMMTFASGALNAISFGRIFNFLSPKAKAGILRYLRTGAEAGLTEAVTEWLEEPAEVAIKSAILPEDKFTREEAIRQLKEGLNVAPPSFVIGALTAGIGAAGAPSTQTRTIPLPGEWYDKASESIQRGTDDQGNPYTMDDVKAFRDAYAQRPYVDPASLQQLDEFIRSYTGQYDAPVETTNLEKFEQYVNSGVTFSDAKTYRDAILGENPELADQLNRVLIDAKARQLFKEPPPQEIQIPDNLEGITARLKEITEEGKGLGTGGGAIIRRNQLKQERQLLLERKKTIESAGSGAQLLESKKGTGVTETLAPSVVVEPTPAPDFKPTAFEQLRGRLTGEEGRWRDVTEEVQEQPAEAVLPEKEGLEEAETVQRPPEKAKEPWEMTREEWVEEQGKRVSGQSAGKTRKLANLLHKDHVKIWLSEGKPVPQRVIDDYPDIQKKEEKGKEPWEMTLDEAWKVEPKLPSPWGKKGDRLPRRPGMTFKNIHRRSVQEALNRGEKIRPEVLADYPDLTRKEEKGKLSLGDDFTKAVVEGFKKFEQTVKVTRITDGASGNPRFVVEAKSRYPVDRLASKLGRLKGIEIHNTGQSNSKTFELDRADAVASFGKLQEAPAKETNPLKAYAVLKAEKEVSFVDIADLRDRLGISQDEMAKMIQADPKRFQTSIGDWSLSDEHTRSGAVEVAGQRQLMVKVVEAKPIPAKQEKVEPGPGKKPSENELADTLIATGFMRQADRGKKQYAYLFRKTIPNNQWLSIVEIKNRLWKPGPDAGGALARQIPQWVQAQLLDTRYRKDGTPVYAWKGTEPQVETLTGAELDQIMEGKEGQTQEEMTKAIEDFFAHERKPVPGKKVEPGPAQEAREGEKALRIGDNARIMGVESTLADTKTIDGIRYDLFNGAALKEKRAAIQITDMESGKVFSVKQYPNFDAAESQFRETIEKVQKGTIKPKEAPRVEEKGKAKAKEGKKEAGRAWIKDQWRPFVEYRELERGKNKGKIQVTVAGRKYLIDRDKVSRWPGEPEAKGKEEKVEVKETPKGPEVSVDLTKAEEKKLTLKEQKAYLLAEIDKAIKEAPEEPEKTTEENAWVKIEIPGDGKFSILNDKKSLATFRKAAQSQWKLGKPSSLITGFGKKELKDLVKQARDMYGDRAAEIIKKQKESLEGLSESEERRLDLLIQELTPSAVTYLHGQQPPPAEVEGEKKPWEMNWDEWVNLFEDTYSGNGFVFAEKVGKPLGIKSQAGEPIYETVIKEKGQQPKRAMVGEEGGLPRDRWRKAVVRKAVEEGKDVSESILNEYPDLATEVKAELGESRDPLVQIERRINLKYKNILNLPEEKDFTGEIYDKIDERQLTPKELDEHLQKADNKEDEIENVKIVIADNVGEIISTHRWEGYEEGKRLERYFDSLLRIIEKHAESKILPPTQLSYLHPEADIKQGKKGRIPPSARANEPLPVEDLAGIEEKYIPKLKGLPEVYPIQSFKDLPDVIQKAYEGSGTALRGAFMTLPNGENRIYQIADNLKDDQDVLLNLLHEGGHHTIKALLGTERHGRFMNTVYWQKRNQITALMNEKGYKYDLSEREGRIKAADEWFARQVADKGFERDPWLKRQFDRLVRMINSALRKLGLKVQLSAAEIREMMRATLERMRTGPKGEARVYSVSAQIDAWHGSPHKFEKFTTEKVGTGEGAQSFGYGLYFTSERDIAQHYARSLSKDIVGQSPIAGVMPSSPDKALTNTAWVAAEELSKSLVPDTGILQPFSKLDVETQRSVLYMMHPLLSDRKVMDAVIRLIPVDVMNMFVGKKFTAKQLLHNPTMLVHLFPVNPDNLVPSQIEAIDILAPVATVTAAKVQTGLSRFNILPKELSTAISTGEHNDLLKLYSKIPHPSEFVKQENIYSVTLHKGKKPGEYDYLKWDEQVPQHQIDKLKIDVDPYKMSDNEIEGILIDQYGWEPRDIELARTDRYIHPGPGEASLTEILEYVTEVTDIPPKITGENLYRTISSRLGSDKKASLFLLRAGIDGIEYPAGTLSGQKKAEARNYVVFDENAVTIEEPKADLGRTEKDIVTLKDPSGIERDIPVLINASEQRLRGLLNRSKEKEIRAMVGPDGTVYAWDATEATHADIADFYKIKRQDAKMYEIPEWDFDKKVEEIKNSGIVGAMAEKPGKADITPVKPGKAEGVELENLKKTSVVDKQGQPLVVYHGVPTRKKYVPGILSPEYAAKQAEIWDKYEKETKDIFKVPNYHLNPDLEEKISAAVQKRDKALQDLGPDPFRGTYKDLGVGYDIGDLSPDHSLDIGIHFGTKEQAKKFTGKGGKIFGAYLNIEKLIEVPDIFSRYDKYVSAVDVLDSEGILKQGAYRNLNIQAKALEKVASELEDYRDIGTHPKYIAFWKNLRNSIDLEKIDGFKYINEVESPGEYSYVALRKDQIIPLPSPSRSGKAEGENPFKESVVQHIVYHGRIEPSSEFGLISPSEGFGVHFGSAKQANEAISGFKGKEHLGSLIPCFIELKNPLRLSDPTRWTLRGIFGRGHTYLAEELVNKKIFTRKQLDKIIHEFDVGMETLAQKYKVPIAFTESWAWDTFKDDVSKAKWIKEATQLENNLNAWARHKIEAKGYDGIVYLNRFEGNEDSYIVFHPNQIESAISPSPSRPPLEGGQEPAIEEPKADISADTESPAFKKWFGKSVVTENGKAGGKPLVVYHGTNSEFKEFNAGSYFTEEPERAKFFAEQWGKTKSNIIPAYLKIENPYTFRMWDPKKTNKHKILPPRSKLAKMGHDGVVLYNVGDEKEYIAFSPTQIKSVFNRGTWDAEVADISADLGEIENRLKDEGDAVLQTILAFRPKNQPYMNVFEKVLRSPEYWQHPKLKKIVRLFTRTRTELFHQNVNELMENTDFRENYDTVLDAAKDLKNKGISLKDRLAGKTSKEYQDLLWAIDYGDTLYKRNKDLPIEEQVARYEQFLKDKGLSEDTLKVWKLYRESYDKALDMMTAQMRQMIEQLEEKAAWTGEEVDTSKLRQTLKGALAQMEEWKGFYAPRIREKGNWVIQGRKGPREAAEHYRAHKGSRYAAERFANQLRREGYHNITITELSKLPEEVYQDLKTASVAKAIEKALGDMGKKGAEFEDKQAMILQFNKELLENVADMIRARGFRSTMIHRQQDQGVVKGYIEDPIERHLTYVRNLSGGLAKAQVAREAILELMGEYVKGKREGGIDPVKERRVYVVAQDYIEEQLRNLDKSDQLVGLAKSIACFKFLGFSPRAAFVNMTAIATTAPTSIHQYVLNGKGSFWKINKELARAGKDFGAFMAGKDLKDTLEAKFLEEVKRKGYDDPQYVRDALGQLNRTSHKIWAKMNDIAMVMFSKTEQWNRGTTMLAAFRLARKRGLPYDQAVDAAKEASDRAHGIYGRSTLPLWAIGRNPAAKVGQSLYTFSKFSHNYLQMMYDLGFNKRNVKGFLYGLLSPVVLGGLAALPFKDVLFGLFGYLLGWVGEDRDPEKWVWDQTRKYLGQAGEFAGRHGLTGLMGVDVSGSLAIGVGLPRNFVELGGPAAGAIQQIGQAGKYLKMGEVGRAAEQVLPAGLANVARAMREKEQGLSTSRHRRVFDEKGRPMMPTPGETALRGFGFRSTRQAVTSERLWESKRQAANYDEKRTEIYERYRAWLLGKRDQKEHKEIMRQIREFNKELQEKGLTRQIAPIKAGSLRRQATGLQRPTKRQRAMME